MDKTRMRAAFLVLALAWGAGALGQSPAESTDQAVRDFEGWIEAMADFVRDVELDEGDVRRILELWPEFEDVESTLPEWDEESPEALRTLVDRALADPTYRDWTAAHGLDGRDWLRKTLRLQSLILREQLIEHRQDYDRASREHTAMIEEQCKQVDEQTCAQMTEALRAAGRMAEAIARAGLKLPAPTQRESILLDANREQLNAVMETEGDPDDEYEEDYGDWEGEEDEEP